MIVGRKLKRNIFIDTDLDCQNCGSWQRVCTWNGECDNLEPLTNEEWFAGLSTKEKAKWMFELTYKCYWCGREYAKTKKFNEKECPFHKCLDDSKGFEKWLKRLHRD